MYKYKKYKNKYINLKKKIQIYNHTNINLEGGVNKIKKTLELIERGQTSGLYDYYEKLYKNNELYNNNIEYNNNKKHYNNIFSAFDLGTTSISKLWYIYDPLGDGKCMIYAVLGTIEDKKYLNKKIKYDLIYDIILDGIEKFYIKFNTNNIEFTKSNSQVLYIYNTYSYNDKINIIQDLLNDGTLSSQVLVVLSLELDINIIVLIYDPTSIDPYVSYILDVPPYISYFENQIVTEQKESIILLIEKNHYKGIKCYSKFLFDQTIISIKDKWIKYNKN